MSEAQGTDNAQGSFEAAGNEEGTGGHEAAGAHAAPGRSEGSRPGITGVYATDGVPHGYTSLTPFLAVPRAAEAIEFYSDVFGARVVDVTRMGGIVVHAELEMSSGRLQLGEPNADFGLVPPPGGDADCCSMGLYCADVDSVVARAATAGAVIREPVSEFVSGDRFASIRDPFGIRWSVMSRVEDLSEEESARRVAEWAAEQEAQ